MYQGYVSPAQGTLRRRGLALALLAVLASGAALAQNTGGSIYGSAAAGATVVVENVDTGLKREAVADAEGRYRFASLPIGTYRVHSGEAVREQVTVNAGVGTEVGLVAQDAATLAAVSVQATRSVSPIDVASVESTTVITADQIARLPVARNVTDVALLAPGTVKGDTAFGNLASFGGSSVAENVYYINGFNVTNIYQGLSYTQLPFEAVQEQQVKTGGYGAEFGRSTGGVVNLVTKRGTNNWNFGGNAYWSPGELRDHSPDVYDPDGDLYYFYSKDTREELIYNAFVSGPVVKDKLFVYALYQGTDGSETNYGLSTVSPEKRNDPLGLLKVDWNITDNHIVELTALTDKRNNDYTKYTTTPGTDRKLARVGEGSYQEGGENTILRYTGYFGESFNLSALYGEGTFSRAESNSNADCPYAHDARTGTAISIGCWVDSTVPSKDNQDERKAGRIDLEWQLGDHRLRGGFDSERITTNHISKLSGGVYWRYITVVPGARLPNGATVPDGVTQAARSRVRNEGGSFEVENTAQYLEDNWQINDKLVAYLGLRNETFENRNGFGQSFIKADQQLAPRLGLSWDVNGDGSMKVFANAGRYFLPIPTNVNVRVSAGLTDYYEWFQFGPNSGFDPRTALPTNLGPQIGGRYTYSDGRAPNPLTLADQELRPMYQDEWILGFQKQLADNWSIGLRGVQRQLKSAIEDTCQKAGITRWAQENGYTNFNANSLPACVMLNPGRDAALYLDLQGDGNLSLATVPAAYFGLPRAERTYRALEFFFEHGFDDKWFLQGSYTWSKSFGNTEGFVRTDNGQVDAGNTTAFDRPGLTDGGSGNLPNDHRHALKVFGYVQATDEWMFGASFRTTSGRPLNCIGVYPENGPDTEAAEYGAASFYCGGVLKPRGSAGNTKWISNLDLSVGYTPQWADNLTLGVDVFNVFNWKRPTELSEDFETGERTPLKTYGLPERFQDPRYVRFSARYDFSL
ncbi:TonB-dependent receptor [Tahibacter amnicola]|uniref:TonB-dependent receptor n=1 Tax=Tahibacter amnicola TaxID=2976241 RepID=A0ABY6BCN4_9GAMM|nr:TonB-dependent receptor [Tahibacter amnicola]UXI67803.1 TonB-dependent receptor [Tahibacter amnicola]